MFLRCARCGGLAMGLIVLTVAVFTLNRPWHALPGTFFFEADFSEGIPGGLEIFRGGEGVEVVGDALKLTSGKGGLPGLSFDVKELGDVKVFQVTTRVRSEAIELGEYGWQCGRVVFFFIDGKGKMHWEGPHQAAGLRGTKGWKTYRAAFPVPDYAVSAVLVIEQLGRSGTLWVDDVRVEAAKRRPGDAIWRGSFGLAWFLVGIYYVWSMGIWRKPGGWGVLVVCGLILAAVGVPNDWVEDVYVRMRDGIYESRAGIAGGEIGKTEREPMPAGMALKWAQGKSVARQGIHVFLFALLGCIVARYARLNGQSGERGWQELWGAILFAGSSETLQLLTMSRSFRGGDWLMDVAGIGAGWIIGKLWERLQQG